jgi:hypothetical protein
MGIVRMLVLCAANFKGPLLQLDVKNVFLHGDLKEDVYMEILSEFAILRVETVSKSMI